MVQSGSLQSWHQPWVWRELKRMRKPPWACQAEQWAQQGQQEWWGWRTRLSHWQCLCCLIVAISGRLRQHQQQQPQSLTRWTNHGWWTYSQWPSVKTQTMEAGRKRGDVARGDHQSDVRSGPTVLASEQLSPLISMIGSVTGQWNWREKYLGLLIWALHSGFGKILLVKSNQVWIKFIKLQIKACKPSHFLILGLFGLRKQ